MQVQSLLRSKDARSTTLQTWASVIHPRYQRPFYTPEDVAVQLNRENIDHVDHVFYTHWHPDHTSGIRVFEQLNWNVYGDEKAGMNKTTNVYLPSKVEEDFRNHHGLMDDLNYFESRNIVNLHRAKEGEIVEINGFKIQCRQMTNPSLYAYLLEEGGKRTLLALDDTYRWTPATDLRGVDLAVLETGWFEKAPDDTVLFGEDHPIRESEASFEETLEKIRITRAKRTILTHIEEVFQHTYDDLKQLERQYEDLKITFAYDGLVVEV
jgi:phosphoribosyl 1,2-cyclic phosphate phosphodiesterase